ncbi:MAG: rod shape-determining protein RodA [Firmicutes bacterium]|nr:rod shape-determining protein RodA [Bacillota bacterium]
MFSRRLWRRCDFLLLTAVMVLALVGLVVIHSATRGDVDFVKRQAVWLGVGFILLFFSAAIDYHSLSRLANLLYVLNLIFRGFVLSPAGREAGGAARWIDLGPIRFQPSEFAKVIIVFTLAVQLGRYSPPLKLWQILVALIHAGIPAMMILRQPDLGTSLVFVGLVLGLLFVSGTKLRHLALILGMGMGAVPLGWRFLKEYQKARIVSFLNPSADPLGAGYQVLQSTTAIGSGQIWGKGLQAGTQSQLGYLPAQHTDFIFSVIGEELGFAGAVFILALFTIVIYRCHRIASDGRDRTGALLAAGVIIVLGVQIFVNVGMTVAMMPVTGIPLPLISYGGSSLIATLVGIGLVLNVGMHRHRLAF